MIAIDWTGTEERNEFTHNALVNLEQLTGQPPKIRVGGNTEDRTVWSPTVTFVEASFPPPSSITPYPEATSIIVGDGFYQLSKWLPTGTHMIWGVNLGLNNVTNAVNMAKSIVKAFGTSEVQSANIHLDLIEVGQSAFLFVSEYTLMPTCFFMQAMKLICTRTMACVHQTSLRKNM